MKAYYEGEIAKKDWSKVTVRTLWLQAEDYPLLLGRVCCVWEWDRVGAPCVGVTVGVVVGVGAVSGASPAIRGSLCRLGCLTPHVLLWAGPANEGLCSYVCVLFFNNRHCFCVCLCCYLSTTGC